MYIDLKNTADDKAYPLSFLLAVDDKLFADRQISFKRTSVEGSYCRIGETLSVEAVISAEISFVCDKCQKKSGTALQIPFNDVFDKEGEYIYDNNIVELDKALTDAVILNMPYQLLCEDACKGICPECGCDRNIRECGCNEATDDKNPFAILKSITGGAKNGSTKV
ncbi:MAG: DUF177 domain-containing protein [Clostridia bacterium]|nr:DUF177 domain-containing protein [Clostridia bacterium]